jgi:hypothetical protein
MVLKVAWMLGEKPRYLYWARFAKSLQLVIYSITLNFSFIFGHHIWNGSRDNIELPVFGGPLCKLGLEYHIQIPTFFGAGVWPREYQELNPINYVQLI